MDAIFDAQECTCVYRCTSNRATTMFCAREIGMKNDAKCSAHLIFTKVHKYTGQIWRHFIEHLFIKTSKKVIKKSEFMYIGEQTWFSRFFLPRTSSAGFEWSVLQKRLYTLKFTDFMEK